MSIDSRELELYAENSAYLYRASLIPILKNLVKHAKRGVYDVAKAIKAWGYYADEAAKEYTKELGASGFSPRPCEMKWRLWWKNIGEKR